MNFARCFVVMWLALQAQPSAFQETGPLADPESVANFLRKSNEMRLARIKELRAEARNPAAKPKLTEIERLERETVYVLGMPQKLELGSIGFVDGRVDHVVGPSQMVVEWEGKRVLCDGVNMTLQRRNGTIPRSEGASLDVILPFMVLPSRDVSIPARRDKPARVETLPVLAVVDLEAVKRVALDLKAAEELEAVLKLITPELKRKKIEEVIKKYPDTPTVQKDAIPALEALGGAAPEVPKPAKSELAPDESERKPTSSKPVPKKQPAPKKIEPKKVEVKKVEPKKPVSELGKE